MPTPGPDGMGRSFRSKVQRSKKASESLRATIPESVAATLGIREGDFLSWMVEPGSTRVVVTRSEK